MSTTMIHVRIEESLKADATETLGAMGLTISDAVRMFLLRVVADQKLPFEVRVAPSGLPARTPAATAPAPKAPQPGNLFEDE